LDLAKYETMLFVKLGIWKSYDDLEENMSLPEIFATLEEVYDADWKDKKFAASMQGIDIPDPNTKTTQEVMSDIVMKANAILAGEDPNSPEAVNKQKFRGLGIEYERI
jgi:hypothetical protein